MQSKALFDELGDTFGVPHGSGPFVVHEWLPAERIEAEARVDHWRANAAFDNLIFVQANEAQQRSAMLQTGAADIAMASIQDVGRLEDEGFRFHEGLDAINGNFFYFSGNLWAFKYPPNSTLGEEDLSGQPVMRKGFLPTAKYPWIGDPRLECVDIDRTDPAIQDTVGAGCDVANFDFEFDGFDSRFADGSVGFDYTDEDRFSYETPSMLSAKAFRKALAFAIDASLSRRPLPAATAALSMAALSPAKHCIRRTPNTKTAGATPSTPTWRNNTSPNRAWRRALSSSSSARRATALL